jgi:hypothetical protein
MAKMTPELYGYMKDRLRILNRKIDSVKAYIVINRNKKISATTKKQQMHYLKRQKAYENRLVKMELKKRHLEAILKRYARFFE